MNVLARYGPAALLSRMPYEPFGPVVLVATHLQCPPTSRWICTGTPWRHVANPSSTVTAPDAKNRWRWCHDTLRWWRRAKRATLVAVPPGVVTDTRPAVPPAGTVAVICVAEFTTNAAPLPLNETPVAPVKFVPVMTTEVPTGPNAGANETIVGGGITVKMPVLVAVPFAVTTRTGPGVAPAGTIAVISVEDTTVNTAAVPLNVTAFTLMKFVPMIVTEVPTGPEVGENEAMVGVVTVKMLGLEAVPLGVVTRMNPVVAPAGTVAVMRVEDLTVKDAGVELKVTAVAPEKFVPVIVTEVPTGPEVGENEVIVGTAVTVKVSVLVAVPAVVLTLIVPEVAPGGTVAVIWVEEFTVNDPDVALNFTSVTFVKFVPVIVTEVPTGPEVGENEVIVGGCAAPAS